MAELLRQAPVAAAGSSYRLRSRLHWEPASGRLGFFARRSHRVADITDCRIVSPALAATRAALEAALAAAACPPGELEWLEDLAGERAVVGFVPAAATDRPRPLQREALPTLVVGAHRLSASGRIEDGWGEREVVIALARPLAVPVGCFVQVNRHLLPWLFVRAGELAGAEPLPAWDLHGGVGFLAAAVLSARVGAMTVVETHAPAARAARRNLPEARVVARTAEAFLAGAGRLPAAALAITDPPRAGLSAELRRRLADWRPRRLLTMACDPGTWARDTAFLLARGYRLAHLELVDLFPSTHHVEILAVLESE